MNRTVVARGKLSDARHIELTEPVSEIQGEVEVIIRQLPASGTRDVFEIIASLPAGKRSKADIDEQIRQERSSWGDR